MTTLRPKDLTEQLTISASTLRLWTEKFGPVLSPAAQRSTAESGGAAQRRFIEDDLEILKRAKRHLAEGRTYEQTLALLQTEPAVTELTETPVEPPEPSQALELRSASADTHPIIKAFEEALRAKDEVIRSKDETIEALHLTLSSKDDQIRSLQATVAPTSQPPTRFRWGFLNRLLTSGSPQAYIHDTTKKTPADP